MKSIFGMLFFMVFGAWLLGIGPSDLLALTAILLAAIIFVLALMIFVALPPESVIGPGDKK